LITARNTDIGALIDSGSSGGAAHELFHIAAANTPANIHVERRSVYGGDMKQFVAAPPLLPEIDQGSNIRVARRDQTLERGVNFLERL